jgi:hypothetical protein
MVRILLPMVAAFGLSYTALADDPLAPCNLTADYLREFAAAHPAQATSEESFPLNALSGQESATSIHFLPIEDFETLEAIESAIAPLKFSPANRQFMDETVYLDLDASWQVIDARSLGNRLVLIQTGGSAYCYQAAIFDASGSDLKPAYTGNFGEGDVCSGFGTSFDFLNVNGQAYPVLWSVPQGGVSYHFSLDIMPPNGGSIVETPSLCSVTVDFANDQPATDWYIATTASDPQLIKRVEALARSLEPAIRHGEDLTPLLQPYLALPDGSDKSDLFQRLAARNDPKAQPADVLTTEEEIELGSSLPTRDWSLRGPYLALRIDGENVIFASGTRSMGWRERAYPSLNAWRWTGSGPAVLVDADFLTQGTSPSINAAGRNQEVQE